MAQNLNSMSINNNLSPEELALENEATQEIKEDEIRSKVIEEYGFDETADGERIDKLVLKEVDSRKKLSQAISQKRKYRDERDALKSTPPPKKVETEQGKVNLSVKDLHALRDVHEDDVDDVLGYAEYRKISIADARKDGVLKTILADKEEKRKTAEATSTGGSRPALKKSDGSTLNKNLAKGEIPEPGSSEAEKLFWERRGGKR